MTISLDQARRALAKAQAMTDLPPAVVTVLKYAAADIDRQTRPRTHHAECWRVHHECAVRRLERLESWAQGSSGDGSQFDAGYVCAEAEVLLMLHGFEPAIREDAGKEREG